MAQIRAMSLLSAKLSQPLQGNRLEEILFYYIAKNRINF